MASSLNLSSDYSKNQRYQISNPKGVDNGIKPFNESSLNVKSFKKSIQDFHKPSYSISLDKSSLDKYKKNASNQKNKINKVYDSIDTTIL